MAPVQDDELKADFMEWFTHWMDSTASFRAPELTTKTWMEFCDRLRVMFEDTPYGSDVNMVLRECLVAGEVAKMRENTTLDADTTRC